MLNLRLIARHEFRKIVSTRTFLATTIGLPLLMVAVFAITILVAQMGRNDKPLGYVDYAGIMASEAAPPHQDELLPLWAYEDEVAAEAALALAEIQTYFVIPAGYPHDARIEQYYWEDAPGIEARQTINAYLQANLISGLPADRQTRLNEGQTIILRSADGRRVVSGSGAFDVIMPLAAAVLFFFAVIGSAGYLLQAVADEKENRTMEIMITSVTPLELIGGKALGLMALSLAQIGLWVATIAMGIIVSANYIDALENVAIPWSLLLTSLLFFLPAYALAASIMIAIGGVVTEVQQGQQIANLLNLLFIFPFFLIILFISDPNNPLIVAMTLFPTTSFVTIVMRWGLTIIPLWQLVLSWLLLTSSALFTVWAAARIFRAGMLRYGQPLNWRAMWAALRAR